MKKFILMAMMMVATISNVNAQKHNLWELWATPKVGAAASNFSTHGGDWMFGPRAGADAEVFFNNRVSLTFDIHYSRIGSKNVFTPYTTQSGEQQTSGPYNYHMDVLNTQYLGKYYIANGVALFTGIHLARLLNAKYDFDGSKSDFKDQLHRGLVSIPAGVAINIGRLQLEAQYDFSLNKVPKTAKAKSILGQCHMHTVSVTLGYRINVLW